MLGLDRDTVAQLLGELRGVECDDVCEPVNDDDEEDEDLEDDDDDFGNEDDEQENYDDVSHINPSV